MENDLGNKTINAITSECDEMIKILAKEGFEYRHTNGVCYKFRSEQIFYSGFDPDFKGFFFFKDVMEPEEKDIVSKFKILERALNTLK